MINNRGKKLLSLLMTTVLSVSMLTVVGGPVSQVNAEEGDKQVACLGTSAINAPEPGEADKEWTGSYVWYGAYDGNPVRYRVLDPNTTDYSGTTMLLDCDSILYNTAFDVDGDANEGATYSNEWAYSDAKNGLNGSEFLDKSNGFTSIEKSSIAESTRGTHDITWGSPVNQNYPKYTPLNKDKVFLLDFEDISNISYGYSSDCGWDAEWNNHAVSNRIKNLDSEAASWWIRSPFIIHGGSAGSVDSDGALFGIDVKWSRGVSPAFNINLESVIFSSVIPETAGEKHADYKLTLKDDDITAALQSGKKIDVKDNKVTIPYTISGKNKDNATQVSVLILDKEYQKANEKDAKILCYGKLDVTGSFSTDGEGTYELPSDLDIYKWGKDYQVYLLAEDVNGEKESDYASEPVKLDIPEALVDYTVEPTPTPEVEPTPTPEVEPTPDITRDANDISPSNPVKVDEIEKSILSIKDEKDTAGSTFTLLKAKGAPKSKKSIKLSWSKVPGAEEYIIYGNKCGKKNKYQKIATVKGTSYTAKKLKKGTYYKYTIVAVKGDEAIATSKTIHVTTDGGKKGNNTKIKLSKTKLSLTAGKSKKIKATLKYKKKVASHRKVAWESDNVSVATVKNGKITAVGKGTCYVYAYAQNGVSAKVKVTVK